ncbi:MAG: MBOAT family protein [Lachnospiraceae bacterium]|nr:MBOAT family protein [Lachnospiraceae bacterium]
MLFNSYLFILIFIPLCLLGYFLLNGFKKYTVAQCFLLGMSLWFYGYFNYYYLLIIVISIFANYGLYHFIGKFRGTKKSKTLMILGVTANLCVLGFFKYTDFFIDNINFVFKSNLPLLHILLPLGISFFTFQQISFIVDTYKGKVGKYGFLHYASFVAFFPQLVAGPIVTHDELINQFEDLQKKRFNTENFTKGLFMFAIGLSKKVLIADVFGAVVNYGYVASERLNTVSAWIVILCYTFQIYFDFSGYSDMAIGLAKMFNIDLPINFNSPYRSVNINDFWDRWHMTLTRFFTKYVYIPLGGNRKGKAKLVLNILIVFFLSGLWHGAGWTFIIWGIMHGLLSIISRAIKKPTNKILCVLSGFVTFIFINITWVFFRADTVTDAIFILGKAFSFNFAPVDPIIINAFRTPELIQLFALADVEQKFPNIIAVIYLITAFVITFLLPNSKKMYDRFKPNILTFVFTFLLFIWSFLSLSGVSTFLYFNF